MIKNLKYIFSLVALVAVISCKSSGPGFTITGEIQGLKDGTVLELKPGATHKNEKGIDTATVENGKFTLEGKDLVEPRLFYITVIADNTYGSLSVMAEPGKMKLTAKASSQEQDGRIMYSFDDVTVDGSPSHLIYKEKTAVRERLNDLYEEYHATGKAICDSVFAARKANDQKLLQNLYKSESWKKFEQDEKNFFNTVDSTMNKMFLDNADSWWGPFLMMDQMSYFSKEQKEIWEKFSDVAKNSYYGQLVNSELFPVGFKGKQAPSFTVTNDKGETITSASLFKNSKYTLVDFWASWCKPCRNEMPNFKKAYEMFSSKGFQIVSISTDKSEQDWKKALDEEKLSWPNFLDRNDIAGTYNIKLIPSTYLVDEKGVVVEENLRGEALLKKLATLFP